MSDKTQRVCVCGNHPLPHPEGYDWRGTFDDAVMAERAKWAREVGLHCLDSGMLAMWLVAIAEDLDSACAVIQQGGGWEAVTRKAR